MDSKLAREARQRQVEQVWAMTPEQRVAAFFEHSRLVQQLYSHGTAHGAAAITRGRQIRTRHVR
jgi:hypothetical protein